MLEWLRDPFGFKARSEIAKERRAREFAELDAYKSSSRYRQIKARYDNAQSSNENADLWRLTDALSAHGANNLAVRKKLRERARYEVANNCHARGITLTVANDIVGTGARLQCLFDDKKRTDDENESYNDTAENAWQQWADEINLAEKLHTFMLATVVDGEAFAVMTTNENLMSPVKLDIRLIECDMVTDPAMTALITPGVVDGIEFDQYGNPSFYHILKYHPGDFGTFVGPDLVTKEPAKNVLHFFRIDRPHQARGVSEITPALHIFGQLRRYTMAVLEAAEIAADFAVFIQTQATPEDVVNVAPFTTTDVDKGMITSLPKGYQAFQLRPEQPTSTHEQFTKSLLREACHCLNIPYNIASADFEKDSYAGGRMAQGVYQREVEVRRKHFQMRILDRILTAWLKEAKTIPGLLPPNMPASAGQVPHMWFFDEWQHVDPLKEANATEIELTQGVTTLADECAKKGKDWRKQVKQTAKEINLKKKLGVLILAPGTPPLDGTPVGSVPPSKTTPPQKGQ